MTQQQQPGAPGPVVTVRLDVLQSVVDSAVSAAVRHAATGLSDSTRGVVFGRLQEVSGLTVARVVASLQASGYVGQPGKVVPTNPIQPEVL